MLHIALKQVSKQSTKGLLLTRSFVKVGDKVPVNYIKDEKPPVIKADSEYPDWLFTITQKGPTLDELLAKYQQVDFAGMTSEELKRMKVLIGLKQIREHNAGKGKGSD